MKNRIDLSRRLALGAAFSATLIARAPAAIAATMPAEVQSGAVTYTTGGVSYEEADLFKSHLHDYPLAIEVVEQQTRGPRDLYTADARVRISKESGGEVLDAQVQGPFMLVRLEPGVYRIDTTLGMRTLHKRNVVVANGRSAQATFIFPAGTD